MGATSAVPLVLLQHFRGNIDDWDPAFTDALAAADEYEEVFAAVGRHPNEATGYDDSVTARLREFAQHHQFRQRRQAARAPVRRLRAKALGEFGRELERQALVAAMVVRVRAHEFIAAMPHQHGTGDEFELFAACAIAEAAAPYI